MADILFPNARPGNIVTVSKATDEYNCLAWAVWDDRHVIWPDQLEQMSWPPSIRRDETVDGIKRFFTMLGFIDCSSDTFETGLEKIAIFAKNGAPTHAARQRASGIWTSKLGTAADVDHRGLADVADQYGQVAAVMRRPYTGRGPTLPRLHPGPPLLVNLSGGPLISP